MAGDLADWSFMWRMAMPPFKVVNSPVCYFSTLTGEDDREVIDVEVELVDVKANAVRLISASDRSRFDEVHVEDLAGIMGAIDAGWPAQVIIEGEEAKLRMISPAAAAIIAEAKAEFEAAWGRYMSILYDDAEGDEKVAMGEAWEARGQYVGLLKWREGT